MILSLHSVYRSPPSLGCRSVSIPVARDRKSTRLNSSHGYISYAVFCLQKNTPPTRFPHPLFKIALLPDLHLDALPSLAAADARPGDEGSHRPALVSLGHPPPHRHATGQ